MIFYKRIGKVGKVIIAVLAIITGFISVWASVEKYSTKNIEGEWYLKFKIEESSYRPYVGETHTQKLFFIQMDNTISGNGEKWEYNGKLLDFSMHRKLEYEGTVKGNEFKAKYIMYGRDRVTDGIIITTISDDGKSLIGTFSGTAANSRGTLKGEKIITK